MHELTLFMGSFNPFTLYHGLEAAVTYSVFGGPVVVMPVLSSEGKELLPLEDRVTIINASLEHPDFKGKMFVDPEKPLTGKKDLVTIFGNGSLLSNLIGKTNLKPFKINQLLGYDVFALKSEDPHFLLSMNYSNLIVTATLKDKHEQQEFVVEDSFEVLFHMHDLMNHGDSTRKKHHHYFSPVPWAEEEYFDDLPEDVIRKKDYALLDKSKWPIPKDRKHVIRKVWQSASTGKYIYFTNYARYGVRSRDIREIAESFVLQQKGFIEGGGSNPFELIRPFMTNDKATKLYLNAMGIKY
jgi:hypothetical protein